MSDQTAVSQIKTIITPIAPRLSQQRAAHPTSLRALPETLVIPVLLVAHLLLGPLLVFAPVLTGLHVLSVLALGVWWAILSPRTERVLYICAYITGAEVLWRMADSPLFWEFGKYAVIGLLLLTALRSNRLRGPVLPLIFFALLLPSTVLPLANLDSTELRKQVSFNLSGPLALAVCTWFFAQTALTGVLLRRMFLSLVLPIVSIGALTLTGILSAKELSFNNSSNFATSGGFGPNQVSAVLGFGALLIFLWLFDKEQSRGLKLTMIAVMLFLMAQSALTFSRGGLYAAGASALVAAYFLVRDRRTRLRLAVGLGVLLVVVNFALLPVLDQFTGGALTKRFADTKLSGRDQIVLSDLQVFYDHMIFGVGPGQARQYREGHNKAAAHTEFSRLLAEHGLFGLTALILMLVLALRHFLNAQTPEAKAAVAALTLWSFLCMASVAMRTVAPAFTFGLAAALMLFPAPAPVPATPLSFENRFAPGRFTPGLSR